ncbi:hypothetical protein R1sor_026579 [Riccia sorocarpa]|uniref:RING-type domain-containing protein n=1 Tax=Riccia sorocarpa TaxID=122646 RepID=A0ABD3GFF9_9MARC
MEGHAAGMGDVSSSATACAGLPSFSKNRFPTPVLHESQPDVAVSNEGSKEDKKVKEDKSLSLDWEISIDILYITVWVDIDRMYVQNTEQHFSKEKDVDKEFFALRREEERVNKKKDMLLHDYYDHFSGIIQFVQDQRENLRYHLTDVQHHSAKLLPKSKEVEAQLVLRLANDKCLRTEADLLVQEQRENLRSRLTDVTHHSANLAPKTKQVEARLKDLRLAAKGKYCKLIKLIKAEKEKRRKTEAKLQSQKETCSNLDAALNFERDKCVKLETELQSEKTRCQSELMQNVLLRGDLRSHLRVLQSERTSREKLESDLNSQEEKFLKLEGDIGSEKARRMLLEEEAKSHESDRVKLEEEMRFEREKRLKLKEDIQSEKEKRLRLEVDLRLSEQKMESEISKLVCQICLEAIRDTIILPCTHFLYCNGCLVQRMTLVFVSELDISLDLGLPT